MNWSRKHTLIAGMALIAAVNAVALSGVAYNRSGEPESRLRFSERELQVPYVWRGNKENSGLALSLQWRVLPPDRGDANRQGWLAGQYSYGVTPEWLNEAKMAALGFDISPASRRVSGRQGFERQLPRDVLLVLELNGAAYQEALERAVKYSAGRAEGEKMLKAARENSSRLYVVDAGLDRDALRARYPDRSRFAILHGQVRPAWQSADKASVLAGSVSDVSVSGLNVPLELKSVFDGASAMVGENTKDAVRYDVDVAFGQRLEPWLMGAARKPPQ